jgi:hypothetical protein
LDELFAIHLDGAFLTTRAALRQIYKQGTGLVAIAYFLTNLTTRL